MKTQQYIRVIYIAIFSLVTLATIAQAQPSFNCAAASSADEQTICADPALAEIDTIVSRRYAGYKPSFQSKRDVGAMYLQDRKSCGADRICIALAQAGAVDAYMNDNTRQSVLWVSSYAKAMIGWRAAEMATRGVSSSSGVPRRIGECVRTRIQEVTTRFGEPVVDYSNDDMGTAVAYENGLSQVSYGRDGLYRIKAGNAVVVCLMSVPHDCPSGDDRGRMYYTLDLDTSSEWILSDSQHMCGGA